MDVTPLQARPRHPSLAPLINFHYLNNLTCGVLGCCTCICSNRFLAFNMLLPPGMHKESVKRKDKQAVWTDSCLGVLTGTILVVTACNATLSNVGGLRNPCPRISSPTGHCSSSNPPLRGSSWPPCRSRTSCSCSPTPMMLPKPPGTPLSPRP